MEILSGRTGTLQVFFKGNYRVEGSAIYFTNILHKQTSLDRNNNIKDTSHDYKSVVNQILLFEFVDFNDTQLLRIAASESHSSGKKEPLSRQHRAAVPVSVSHPFRF